MLPSLHVTPLPSLNLTTHPIPPHSHLPNCPPPSPPLYIYHSAYPPSTSPSALESHLRTNNLVPQWRYTMYQTTHYHSTTHEILCVYRGAARLCFGGEENPGRVEAVLKAGDCVVLPAGVGHRLLEDLSGDDGDGEEGFMMIGAYPPGCSWDMCYGREGEEAKAEAVKKVKWLEKDPLYGDDGPVLWGEEKLKQHQSELAKKKTNENA
ncbi:uncharacterized protein EI97DRAFT_370869 [Westerdykella ornata]|uniref:Cupin type-2 domain-containing protein n=1 Tax=Westerdykella ornata TaxID=318751 RepID=A0A6A6JRS4_WESOR|nr:uncharacterized protein EI97DRAFT_370869 [Westerdykella ornata]KAF2279300.1 hypothetical protein EI97DRAFT_370869 [Westerdykella ornata]